MKFKGTKSYISTEDLSLSVNAAVELEKPLLIKNGGHSDQLSKKYWGMDRFRVLSMEKLLKNDLLTEYQRNAIHNELIFKLDILINGARKRDNTSFFAEMSKKKYLYQCLQKD